MDSFRKKYFIGVTLLLMGMVLGGTLASALFVIYDNKQPTTKNNIVPPVQPTLTPIPYTRILPSPTNVPYTPVVLQSSDIKTYTGKDYGLSFSYPKNFTVDVQTTKHASAGTVFEALDDNEISITVTGKSFFLNININSLTTGYNGMLDASRMLCTPNSSNFDYNKAISNLLDLPNIRINNDEKGPIRQGTFAADATLCGINDKSLLHPYLSGTYQFNKTFVDNKGKNFEVFADIIYKDLQNEISNNLFNPTTTSLNKKLLDKDNVSLNEELKNFDYIINTLKVGK